jgi:hypothetical protein
MKRPLFIFLSFLLLITSCCNDKELSVSDFKFDGPLGCKGATIEKIGKNHFKLIPGHAPNHPNWPNMIQFQITGNAKGNSLRLDVDFPVEKSSYHYDDYFCSWSHNKISWKPLKWREYRHNDSRWSNVLIFPEFQKDVVYVGHQVPLSYENLTRLIAKWEKHPAVKVNILGKSIEGRNIYRLSVTNHSINNQKWVHYFTNQHPGEHNAQWRMVGMLKWLLSKKGKHYLDNSINHFVFMMSPDGPANGWYRTNAQGIDGNRSYIHTGADKEKQAHEAYICQKDLEDLMKSDKPATDIWNMHTWQGAVEPIMIKGPEFGNEVGEWTELRDIIKKNDETLLIEPLRVNEKQEGGNKKYWTYGPHAQFGITAVLCEGAGNLYTKEENINSGKVLMKSIAEFYK